MAEDDPRERIWGFVASEVAQRFGLLTGRSPTLTATINHGARYVKLEADAILFDSQALTLGLLAVGTPDPTGVRYGNAAFWFREWLQERASASAISEVLVSHATAVGEVERALNQKTPVALSVSVQDLVRRASTISDATVKHTAFEGRHLFAAMIAKGTVADQLQQLFGLSVTPDDMAGLKALLVDRIVLTPAEGETREIWVSAIGLSSAPPPGRPANIPGQEIIRFSHDSVGRGDDVLETRRDVEALAKLICLKGSTPLAVAIFGGWGSGKTTFMEALDSKVAEIADQEAGWVKGGANSPFVTRIVQIRFNAWQFVDANLWASLTAEFFDQLRAGGWRRAGTARHAGLVERVNSHVHSLSADAVARREALIESNRHVLEAMEARDAAAKAVRDAKKKALSQAALDTLGEIYEAQKGNLRALGISRGGRDPTQGVDAVIDAVRSSRSIVQRAGTIFRLIRKHRPIAALIAVLLLVAAGGLLLWFRQFEGVDLAAAVAAFVALGQLARTVLPAFNLVASAGRLGADIARDLEAADRPAVKVLLGKEAALRDATAKADALAGSAEQAERKLARYVDPTAPSNPPRLLRYVLEDDPETKAFEKEIGLIGRARRLFQAVDDIIREEASPAGGAQGDNETPQRIVLYIDDLDRCTEEQVYNVLQAIHLLLAFDSFAVVVGVDVKWIEGALAAEFAADRLPPLSEIDRRQHAVHYLEKIFQVAFWLDPLSTGGKDGGSYARFVNELTKPELVPPAAPTPPSPAPNPNATAEGGDPDAETEGGQGQDSLASAENRPAGSARGLVKRLIDLYRRARSRLAGGGERPDDETAAQSGGDVRQGEAPATENTPPAGPEAGATEAHPAREVFRTVEIDELEIGFLASAEIAALAGSTPRSVKRLVNVSRLVRSRLADSGHSLLGSDAEAPDYPLVALATAIETGQPVEVASAFLNALKNLLPPEAKITILKAALPDDKGPPKVDLSSGFKKMFADQLRADGEAKSKALADAIISQKCPALLPALAEVHRLRKGNVAAGDVLRVAKLARRFSFNRYQ